MRRILCVCVGLSVLAAGAVTADEARDYLTGVVFHDENANGVRDSGEPGIAGVGVSNGVEVTVTGDDGRYRLPVEGDCTVFVIVPSGWATPVDPVTQVPQFHYVHRPEGSPELRYPGVAPTGPLPDAVDFPLTPAPEDGPFTAVILGDTQARDDEEVAYIVRDIVAELSKEDGVAFGVTLGDFVFDDLSVFEPLVEAFGLTGFPWRHVIGNHDMNFDAPEAHQAYEAFARVFGPDYYSFNRGDVHFLVLNSIRWDPAERRYHGGLGEKQLAFVENSLAHVPQDKLVVALMHIPLTTWDQDREELLALLSAYPNTVSFSAHWHRQEHFFVGEDMGWQGDGAHHHIVHATASGSWWGGHLDEVGIPHGVMADGVPNGHTFVTFEGNSYRTRFKVPRRPADYQMNITAPDRVARAEAGGTEVVVNVFAGNARSEVWMRLGQTGEWAPMTQFTGLAPHAVRMNRRQMKLVELLAECMGIEDLSRENLRRIEAVIRPILGRGLPDPRDTDHLWKGTLPENPPAGYHFIHVKTEDMHGQVWEGRRPIRVEE